MFQASEERRLQIEREKQYRTNRQRYLREFGLCLGWDETRDRGVSEGVVSRKLAEPQNKCTREKTLLKCYI